MDAGGGTPLPLGVPEGESQPPDERGSLCDGCGGRNPPSPWRTKGRSPDQPGVPGGPDGGSSRHRGPAPAQN